MKEAPTRHPEIRPQAVLADQLFQACTAERWLDKNLRENGPFVMVRPQPEGPDEEHLMTYHTLRGVKKAVFARFQDMREAGYAGQAKQILDEHRALQPKEPLREERFSLSDVTMRVRL